MPKLYEYFGLVVMFYANEHEPVHVHGKTQGRECRGEIVVVDGQVVDVRFRPVTGRALLEPQEMRYFEELVVAKSEEIVKKWIDFFVMHKAVRPQLITRRLR